MNTFIRTKQHKKKEKKNSIYTVKKEQNLYSKIWKK